MKSRHSRVWFVCVLAIGVGACGMSESEAKRLLTLHEKEITSLYCVWRPGVPVTVEPRGLKIGYGSDQDVWENEKGRCGAKVMDYIGFQGHLVLTRKGLTTGADVAEDGKAVRFVCGSRVPSKIADIKSSGDETTVTYTEEFSESPFLAGFAKCVEKVDTEGLGKTTFKRDASGVWQVKR